MIHSCNFAKDLFSLHLISEYWSYDQKLNSFYFAFLTYGGYFLFKSLFLNLPWPPYIVLIYCVFKNLTFINVMFLAFTQFVYFHQLFEKWTVRKSWFDSFQKVVFYSLPIFGQLHHFVFIIKGKLWEVVKNSKRPYLYHKVNNKKSWSNG